MAAPQPKILSVITVPTGGYDLQMKITNAVQWDTTVKLSDGGDEIPAGDYFMAWSGEDNCFIQALHDAVYAALDGCAVAAYNPANSTGKPIFWLDSDHKTNIIWGGAEIRFEWDQVDGPDIAAILGFDSSNDTDLTDSTPAVSDWHHAYGWYADDYLLRSDFPEDHNIPQVLQSRAPDGKTRTIYLDSWDINEFKLGHVPLAKMFSRRVGYTESSVHPYAKNEPLQCWWNEARQGKRFRVYSHESYDMTTATEQGTSSAAGSDYIQDASKSWELDPGEHTGRILQTAYRASGANARYYIDEMVSTARVSLLNDLHNSSPHTGNTLYYILDHKYGTYVLDRNRIREFAPEEMPKIDKYNLTIPVLRYV
jgi:hypothetical protein